MAGRKRGNGEGSIRRRPDGTYEARYTVQTATGQKRKSVYGKTRGEVAEKLTAALSDRSQGLVYDTGKLSVGDYLSRWLDDVESTIRPKSYYRYEQLSRVHIAPAIGAVKLAKLTPAHVQSLYRVKLDSGLSPRTVQYIHATLHKALKRAVQWGMIPRNAAAAVTPPRPDKPDVQTLDAVQVQTLLAAASETGDRLEALYTLAVTTGLRQGELLGLRWQDVDQDSGTLQVRRTLSRTKDGYVFGPPKTAKGKRSVRLTPGAVAALNAHRRRQNAERLAAGNWPAPELIFPSKVGTPLSVETLTRWSFRPLLEKAGLPQIKFHALRHTAATLLLSGGVHPKVVQEMLGHSTISITLDTYSHVLPNMQETAVAAMRNALG